ncbi:hypothetical protein TNCV_5063261 [Trichonephila clavipes]|nr:hypothetical protein TNCV_5063261 [Trichonephila clavipes]
MKGQCDLRYCSIRGLTQVGDNNNKKQFPDKQEGGLLGRKQGSELTRAASELEPPLHTTAEEGHLTSSDLTSLLTVNAERPKVLNPRLDNTG